MIKEINQPKDRLKLAIKIANTVFISGIILSFLLFVFTLYKIFNPPEFVANKFYYIILIFTGFSIILFYLGLKLKKNSKVNLSILLITIFLSIYTMEIYFAFPAILLSFQKEKMSNFDVLEDLNNSGIESYLNYYPFLLVESDGLKTKNGKIYPLGGISNITTILGNESGFFPIIKTDEYGFNNPTGLYKSNNIDILLTGDSFTEGMSVNSNDNISAVLRESGFNKVVNIGKRGNGPLLELAALKEYAQPFKPRIVLWLYFVFDLNDLKAELNSSILKNYLNDDNFSQNLILRQDEIDIVLKNYIKKERKKGKNKVEFLSPWFVRIMKIYNIRSRIRLKPVAQLHEIKEQEIEIFKNILIKSNKMVSEWGGKLYFVYLPSKDLYSNKHMLNTVSKLDIPIINIYKEVFASHPNPLSLFPYYGDHYNEKGYRLVAETINNRLSKDGIIKSNKNN